MTTAISESFTHQRGKDFIIDHQHALTTSTRHLELLQWGNAHQIHLFHGKLATLLSQESLNVPSAHARQLKARVETAQTIEHHANKLVIDQALKPVERIVVGGPSSLHQRHHISHLLSRSHNNDRTLTSASDTLTKTLRTDVCQENDTESVQFVWRDR